MYRCKCPSRSFSSACTASSFDALSPKTRSQISPLGRIRSTPPSTSSRPGRRHCDFIVIPKKKPSGVAMYWSLSSWPWHEHGLPFSCAHCSVEVSSLFVTLRLTLESHGQPLARNHCSTSRWPPNAAASQAPASHRQPLAGAQRSISRCPISVALEHVDLSHELASCYSDLLVE
jgi:hypothetical protein